MLELETLFEETQRNGWAAGAMSVVALRNQMEKLRWKGVPIRRSEEFFASLRPTATEDAPTASLSAIYGLGNQPLHTDGAHLENPPNIVILTSELPNATPTRLWTLAPGNKLPREDFPFHAFGNGVFLVTGQGQNFFSPCLVGGNLRFDPGCMKACDERALQVVSYLNAAQSESVEHDWATKKGILMIDNQKTLHSRAAVHTGDLEREIIRVAVMTQASR
jgi:hypothetical protein